MYDVDAIFCSYDMFAKVAISRLRKYNVKVPENIIITGFNNSLSDLSPKLTTVDPSFYGIGYTSLQTILKLTGGKNVAKEIYVPSQVIIRQSCGCNKTPVSTINFEKVDKSINNSVLEDLRKNFFANIEDFKRSIEEILNNYESDFGIEFLDDFLKIIFAQISTNSFEDVQSKFNDYKTLFLNSKNIYAFEQILSSAKNRINTFIPDNDIKKSVELVFSQWYDLLYTTREYVENSKWSLTPDEISYFSVRGRFLATANSLPNLFDIIEKDLSLYNIPGCFIILFDKNGQKELVLSITDFQRRSLGNEAVILEKESILPKHYQIVGA
jgi:hypothetical protein